MAVQERVGRCRPAWGGFLEERMPPLRSSELRELEGKHLLITGAGGYLGSAVARYLAGSLAGNRDGKLILLDSAEYGLYRLNEDLLARNTAMPYTLRVGSVTNAAFVRKLFSSYRPDIVIHAAAHKHVPLMEDNIVAAAESNTIGTWILGQQAAQAGTERFLLLSTDKAVNPISVMGYTKQLAEGIVCDAREASRDTSFGALRLPNVLGSTGSVAPLFAREIARGLPLTVTDPRATRFFLSRQDAVRAIVRAVTIIPRAGLLLPSVGEPHRIDDLARYMLNRAAASPEYITYTGLRAADKLHEVMLSADEHTTDLGLGLQAVHSTWDRDLLLQTMTQLQEAVRDQSPRQVLACLHRALAPLSASAPSSRIGSASA